ncbi:uncharacterized protein K02A2.6-like [Ornithodoros turicata]|uniref:uncharacterized protein K02A2.6-like n=1 Tax=Ornithodoros turicata TaxID=34597 RepID=UPI00313A04D9
MVIVKKPNGTYRICVDYTPLNKFVERELHPMPVTDHVIAQIGVSKYFSKLDANSGYWQFQLTEESQLLTTFITPFGRFKFTRLPFGISSAPEFFQKKMAHIVSGLDGVVCNMDDILVHAKTREEHDDRVRKVLARLQDYGVTLNKDKCVFGVQRVKFLGHIIDQEGIHPDDTKVKAIQDMKPPTSLTELKSFLGMVNYLGKFIPHLADVVSPLNALLSSKSQWVWTEAQQRAFKTVKTLLTTSPVLVFFDPKKRTVVSADASSYGLGAILRQLQPDGTYRPVAYASRSLTDTEKKYAQIEKEGLAIVWACDKFRDYITGIHITIETDHKPLIPIFMNKPLDDITPRLQRMKLKLMRHSCDLVHVPGKSLVAADVLSRSPLPDIEDSGLEDELAAYVRGIVTYFPATDQRLSQIKKAQYEDTSCQMLSNYLQQGWPDKTLVDSSCKNYWQERFNLSLDDGLLMKGSRILIPVAMRREILNKIHEGHAGITKCRERARQTVWWPGISKDIEDDVRRCPRCVQESTNRHEPLMPSPFPERPWQKVAVDLFYLSGKWFLLVTDYYSRYPELAPLTNLTSSAVIDHLKSIFARHGTPEVLISDNGPQFRRLVGSDFATFAKEWSFEHRTSSPRFPQSNGFVEAAVRVTKLSLKKSDDAYKALQSYRATPLGNGFSPAELLMGRRLRTSLPTAASLLSPKTPDRNQLRQWEERRIEMQKRNYDRHGVRTLPPLRQGERVWITDTRLSGVVQAPAAAPRSYNIQMDDGVLRRNRFHLIPVPSPSSDCPQKGPSAETLAAPTSDSRPQELGGGTGPGPERVVSARSSSREVSQAGSSDSSGHQPGDHPPHNPTGMTTRSGRVVKPVKRLQVGFE